MTRANINFIYQKRGHSPRTLYFYWNGDQYPAGIRDYYNILEFVEGDMTAERFQEWANENYKGVKVSNIQQPKVYYTDGFITDYSYCFEACHNQILVWEWEKLIFDGDKDKFIKWIKKQE